MRGINSEKVAGGMDYSGNRGEDNSGNQRISRRENTRIGCGKRKKINRYRLVMRNSPALESPDASSPFTVGNGEFAFTADITGLQTFMDDYEYFPLCTMSQWGWHSFPADMDYSKLRLKQYDTYGRMVGYASDDSGQEQLFKNLRENPHRLNLGAIGLSMVKNGRRAAIPDLSNTRQKLVLWRGLLISGFRVFGKTVRVETCSDPELDAVSACVRSELVMSGEIEIQLSFPYGSPGKNASDWEKEDAHVSEMVVVADNRVIIERVLDSDVYYADIVLGHGSGIRKTGRHRFVITAGQDSKEISFTCRFSPGMPEEAPYDFYETKRRASVHWKRFWKSGGAVQLVNSKDERAVELERRIVLSQYLTAIQCSGSTPPAETGLSCNSWYGKFHLEMHYWHAAHFALWGRLSLLERSLEWYGKISPQAGKIASGQGYKGARWPKMCGPEGVDSPSPIGVLLAWQQPHPIMLAELCYRANPTRETLEKYRDLVVESADFMVSFVHYDALRDRYVIGPPIIPAQEVHEPSKCINPPFELEYFRWGLKTANEWLVRLGEAPDDRYSAVAGKLSGLPVIDGVYISQENCPETYARAPFYHDHPSMLAAFGVLPGESVDRTVMRNTVEKVLERWDFNTVWGWDFAMIAMCCARLGMTSLAVDMLLMDKPKNAFSKNGHNPQADRDDLPLYLPGNGGLLLAVAMMAAGWDGDGGKPAPGFPSDGNWTVEAEGIAKYI